MLDAYTVIAYLRGGEAASGEVRELLRAPTILSAVNAAEVADQLVRIDDNDPDGVEIRLATLEVGGMTIAPATHSQAVAAGSLRALLQPTHVRGEPSRLFRCRHRA